MLYAFDMFGTLADTASVVAEIEPLGGVHSAEVAARWRSKQLEYMFRVTAMGQFPTFAELTEWGLRDALQAFGIEVPSDHRLGELVECYRRLSPYPDVAPGLRALHDHGDRLVVFSVGPRTWLGDLTVSYRESIDDIVSAEDAGCYKPHPDIYRHLLASTGSIPEATTLVSSNPWDLIGAGYVGLQTIWCRRDEHASFDSWGPRPGRTVTDLNELVG